MVVKIHSNIWVLSLKKKGVNLWKLFQKNMHTEIKMTPLSCYNCLVCEECITDIHEKYIQTHISFDVSVIEVAEDVNGLWKVISLNVDPIVLFEQIGQENANERCIKPL